MNKEIMDLIIRLVITLFTMLVTMYVIPWIKAKIGVTKLEEITHYAEIAVRCAEQIFTENKDKKEYVVEYLHQKAFQLGMNLSYDDIDSLVESTVNYIKYGTEYKR